MTRDLRGTTFIFRRLIADTVPEEASGDLVNEPLNQDALRQAMGDARKASSADQMVADADQSASDADQVSSDADHTASDRDQTGADGDQ